MNPRPIQQPRPPLVIAAMGPVMLKYAAQHADNWNSLSSAREFETQLEETRRRIHLVNRYCSEIDRDPASLRRSYLMFDANARLSGGLFRYYRSPDIFADMVRRIIDLGISEIGVYYPFRAEQLPVFEKIAAEVIPLLKVQHTAGIGH